MAETVKLQRQDNMYNRIHHSIRIEKPQIWEALGRKPIMEIPYGHFLKAIDPKDLKVGNIIIVRTDKAHAFGIMMARIHGEPDSYTDTEREKGFGYIFRVVEWLADIPSFPYAPTTHIEQVDHRITSPLFRKQGYIARLTSPIVCGTRAVLDESVRTFNTGNKILLIPENTYSTTDVMQIAVVEDDSHLRSMLMGESIDHILAHAS